MPGSPPAPTRSPTPRCHPGALRGGGEVAPYLRPPPPSWGSDRRPEGRTDRPRGRHEAGASLSRRARAQRHKRAQRGPPPAPAAPHPPTRLGPLPARQAPPSPPTRGRARRQPGAPPTGARTGGGVGNHLKRCWWWSWSWPPPLIPLLPPPPPLPFSPSSPPVGPEAGARRLRAAARCPVVAAERLPEAPWPRRAASGRRQRTAPQQGGHGPAACARPTPRAAHARAPPPLRCWGGSAEWRPSPPRCEGAPMGDAEGRGQGRALPCPPGPSRPRQGSGSDSGGMPRLQLRLGAPRCPGCCQPQK